MYGMNLQELIQHFTQIRTVTETLCNPLALEDYLVQSCENVSPPKWHLAHTSWFFENFILIHELPHYKIFDKSFIYLFNSYYNGIGKIYPRHKRGILSRPTIKVVYEYRKYINENMLNLINSTNFNVNKIVPLILLGMHHEQQHQELILMDIKHNFSFNLDFPSYTSIPQIITPSKKLPLTFHLITEDLAYIGHDHRSNEFCYDNELPIHKKFLHTYEIANRLITNEEYLAFIHDQGYKRPELWLMDGWNYINTHKIECPLYWHHIDNEWHLFTLTGLAKLNPLSPVSHISFYEADAYARWCKARLPLEEEWEFAVKNLNCKVEDGNFLENKYHAPLIAMETNSQFFGDLWEWTNSTYNPYPGYRPLEGTAGEYNGKFMNNQKVLRGGSHSTPKLHIRATYRNYYPQECRWMFSGIRLARDVR